LAAQLALGVGVVTVTLVFTPVKALTPGCVVSFVSLGCVVSVVSVLLLPSSLSHAARARNGVTTQGINRFI
jgi:hypothetical protein